MQVIETQQHVFQGFHQTLLLCRRYLPAPAGMFFFCISGVFSRSVAQGIGAFI